MLSAMSSNRAIEDRRKKHEEIRPSDKGSPRNDPRRWIRYEPGSLLLPQSHNFHLDVGWIAKDGAIVVKEVRIDGIEAVAETDDAGGDV